MKRTPISYAEHLLEYNQYREVDRRKDLYLQLQPKADAKFFTLLQKLEEKERKDAVQHDYVKEQVERALKKKFPTFLLLLDLVFILFVIPCFGIAVVRYNKFLFHGEDFKKLKLHGLLAVVIAGGSYFLVREVMQAFALFKTGIFFKWWTDPTNYIDIICLLIMIVWPILMNHKCGTMKKAEFRSLSTLAAGFLFLLVFSFLKRVSKDFAVFVQGLIAVAKRLLSFIAASIIIITAFALMFYAMFIGSNDCSQFCTYLSSWFEVYNMILGNYGPNDVFGVDPFNFTQAVGYNSSKLVYNGSIYLEPSYSLSHDPWVYVIFYILYAIF
jgi:hypothetical protein